MAKVSNELDVREAMGLTGDAQKTIEDAEWVILDCAPDFKYVDGKKTDSQSGTTVLLGGPRSGDKLVRNKEMKVKLDEVWTEDDCKKVIDEAPEVKVHVTRAVVWGSSKMNTEFVKIDLSIHASLITLEGEFFNPKDLK